MATYVALFWLFSSSWLFFVVIVVIVVVVENQSVGSDGAAAGERD